MDSNGLLLCVLVAYLTKFRFLQFQDLQEYCQWESFNATCADNQVVLVRSAVYGRMSTGRCIPVNYSIGCASDVLELVEGYCSGKPSCSVMVSEPAIFVVQPCRKDLVPFMQASYVCVAVSAVFISEGGEDQCGSFPRTTDSSGYLSTQITSSFPGPRSKICPWLIESSPGQRVNVTIYDFSAVSSRRQSNKWVYEHQYDTRCPVIFIMSEDNRRRHFFRRCDQSQRKSHAYLSHGHLLSIQASRAVLESRDYTLLLHYKVIGCPDLNHTHGAILNRRGDTLIVSCNNSVERWHLVCKSNEWIGSYSNCTSSSVIRQQVHRRQVMKLPVGVLVAIGVGIIVGVTVGFVFLCTIFACRTRLPLRNQERDILLMDYDTHKKVMVTDSTNNHHHQLYDYCHRLSKQISEDPTNICHRLTCPDVSMGCDRRETTSDLGAEICFSEADLRNKLKLANGLDTTARSSESPQKSC